MTCVIYFIYYPPLDCSLVWW